VPVNGLEAKNSAKSEFAILRITDAETVAEEEFWLFRLGAERE